MVRDDELATKPLHHLRTPAAGEWIGRKHGSGDDDDPRDPFERDRDRILYSESFRRLQHKTQVFIVTESDLFSTRILHSMETAQIGRALATMLGLNECLAEAICLGHDVGHTPFGHIGEETLKECLGAWDSNAHSLYVLEEAEEQYPDFLGLDLTWAVCEGIARHKTVFDIPASEHGDETGFGKYRAPSLEAQVANVADEVAYLTHDIHDALQYKLIEPEDLDQLQIDIWRRAWIMTNGEFSVAHPTGWPGVDRFGVMVRRAHRHMINILVTDAYEQSMRNGSPVADLAAARTLSAPVIAFSEQVQKARKVLVGFLMERVYKGPLVARQNFKSKCLLKALFDALCADTRLLPFYVRERLHAEGEADEVTRKHVAYFLASLTDRAAIDLYRELFAPEDRAMGHHVR